MNARALLSCALNATLPQCINCTGVSKLQALNNIQAQMCEAMLTERLEKVDFQIDQIKDAEFVGIYEMVTEELCPIDLEHILKEAEPLGGKQ